MQLRNAVRSYKNLINDTDYMINRLNNQLTELRLVGLYTFSAYSDYENNVGGVLLQDVNFRVLDVRLLYEALIRESEMLMQLKYGLDKFPYI